MNDENPAVIEDQYTGMHWKKVKAAVEAAEGEWIDMKQGLIFLRGLVGDATDEDPGDEDDVVTSDDLENEPSETPIFDPNEYHSTVAGWTNVAYIQGGHSFTASKTYIDPKDIE